MMIPPSALRCVVWFALGLSPLFAIEHADLNDPVIRKYLKDADEAAEKFEKEHPAEVKVVVDRLKKVHQGLYKYLLDHHAVWPQRPANLQDEAIGNWWKNILLPYGVAAGDWDAYPPLGITSFEETPLIAYRWKGQPWIICYGPASWPAFMIVADGTIVKSGLSLVETPKSPGRLTLDTGGSEPAQIPDEMKKAVRAK